MNDLCLICGENERLTGKSICSQCLTKHSQKNQKSTQKHGGDIPTSFCFWVITCYLGSFLTICSPNTIFHGAIITGFLFAFESYREVLKARYSFIAIFFHILGGLLGGIVLFITIASMWGWLKI